MRGRPFSVGDGQSFRVAELPTFRVLNEAELGVIVHGGGRGDEADFAARAELLQRVRHERATDAAPLVTDIHREIREVAGITEIGDGARHADQGGAVPGRHHQVCVLDHAFHARAVGDGAPLAERRAREHVDELVRAERAIRPIFEPCLHGRERTPSLIGQRSRHFPIDPPIELSDRRGGRHGLPRSPAALFRYGRRADRGREIMTTSPVGRQVPGRMRALSSAELFAAYHSAGHAIAAGAIEELSRGVPNRRPPLENALFEGWLNFTASGHAAEKELACRLGLRWRRVVSNAGDDLEACRLLIGEQTGEDHRDWILLHWTRAVARASRLLTANWSEVVKLAELQASYHRGADP